MGLGAEKMVQSVKFLALKHKDLSVSSRTHIKKKSSKVVSNLGGGEVDMGAQW